MRSLESVKELMRRIRPSKYGWTGDYSTWEEAEKECSGYDAETILLKVKQSVLQVKNGNYPYERDSVLFDEVEYSWPLLSGLLWTAAQRKGKLHIADFGGSLGSSYFQNRLFLDSLEKLTWSVIEQSNFVTAGIESVQDDKLRFFYTMDECITAAGRPDLLLFSCVLPYLPEPYVVLEQLMNYRIPYILIDNTYFNYEERDRICIQRVPPSIYEASYPCWFLDHQHIKSCLEKKYAVVTEHKNDSYIFLDGKKIQYRGLLLKSKANEDHR
jgi:putative methyltransferase (TIGR04325 family)